MKRSSLVTIHPEALQHNLLQAKKAAPDSKVMAVIKANAYGHGAVETAGILYQLADAYAVSCINEAMELRDVKIDLPIAVLQGPQNDNDLRIANSQKLRLVIHHQSQLGLLDNFSGLSSTGFDITIKLDTGMHRLGFDPALTESLYSKLKNHPLVNPNTIEFMTHLSCADDLENNNTLQQIEQFKQATDALKGDKSIANSAGILGWTESHTEWIRPGIMLYGSSPFINSSDKKTDLKATMTFSAPVIAIKNVKKGDSIGYGATWQCPEDMTVGVIACGYADGYPRHASSGTPVWINGQEVSLIGRVSMDMIVVDVSQHDNTQVGDFAELWGENLAVDSVAHHAETISYELLCNAGNIRLAGAGN